MRLHLRLYLLFFVILLTIGCKKILPKKEPSINALTVLIQEGETTYLTEGNTQSGFEYELITALGDHLQLPVHYLVAKNDEEIARRLKKGEADLAAGWQTVTDVSGIASSRPYFESVDIFATNDDALPILKIAQLVDKTVYAVSGSHQEKILKDLSPKVPTLIIKTRPHQSAMSLLGELSEMRVDAVFTDRALFDVAKNYYPELQAGFALMPPKKIVFLFAPKTDNARIDAVNAFLDDFEKSGKLSQLKDRYFGHINRLNAQDSAFFIQNMRTLLPTYRHLFQKAQLRTGIDWRILAALGYQESKWMPFVTSATNVRGIMMLTETTADYYGVQNRLDPEESILGGAKYLADLIEAMPKEVKEPDRLWMALSAYNLGLGHFRAARQIAISEGIHPNAWYEMKKVLPLLAKPEYYSRLKSGKGRGGEAVILVENVRGYADILMRYESAFDPLKSLPAPPAKTLGAQK